MKIFLDTADIDAIKKWVALGIIDGVTTNPTLLSKQGGNSKKIIQEIAELLPAGDVSVEVTEEDPKKLYEQAHIIADLGENITVKIPCHRDYYAVINTLTQEGIPLNITLVFTLIQALMMAKLGVRYISPFVGRWDDIDIDGIQLISEIRDMLDEYQFSTKVLTASIRGVRHLHDAINAGSHIATVPISVLEKATEHPLTQHGIKRFLDDWKKLEIQQFP